VGTLGTDALGPGTVIDRVHAVLVTGGSTFGLAAATGIMRYLEERGVGVPFGSVRVPVVVGAVLFDLLTGDASARPGRWRGSSAW
jgi:L-aminopeptidase/D-esterase-like protein